MYTWVIYRAWLALRALRIWIRTSNWTQLARVHCPTPQNERLHELVYATFDDLEEADKATGDDTSEHLSSSSPSSPSTAPSPPRWVTDVVATTSTLMTHLHCLDMQLEQFRQRCGAGIAGYGSGGSSSILTLLERGSLCLSERSGNSGGQARLGGQEVDHRASLPERQPRITPPRDDDDRDSMPCVAPHMPSGSTSSSVRSLHDDLERLRLEQLSPMDQIYIWKDRGDLSDDEALSKAVIGGPRVGEDSSARPNEGLHPAWGVRTPDGEGDSALVEEIIPSGCAASDGIAASFHPDAASFGAAIAATKFLAAAAAETMDAVSPFGAHSLMNGTDTDDTASSTVHGGTSYTVHGGMAAGSSVFRGRSFVSLGGPEAFEATPGLESRPISDPLFCYPLCSCTGVDTYKDGGAHAGSPDETTTASQCPERLPEATTASPAVSLMPLTSAPPDGGKGSTAPGPSSDSISPGSPRSRSGSPPPHRTAPGPSSDSMSPILRGSSSAASSGWPAVLRYGRHSLSLSKEECRALRSHSGLLRVWTAAARRQALHTVLKVPGLTDEENLEVVKCLVATGGGPATNGRQTSSSSSRDAAAVVVIPERKAALMWRASHFYQADRLKLICEDVLMAGLRKWAAADGAGGATGRSSSHLNGCIVGAAGGPSCGKRQPVPVWEAATAATAAASAEDEADTGTAATAALSEVLELGECFSGGDASARLKHLVAAWLMENLHRLLECREVSRVECREVSRVESSDVSDPAFIFPAPLIPQAVSR